MKLGEAAGQKSSTAGKPAGPPLRLAWAGWARGRAGEPAGAAGCGGCPSWDMVLKKHAEPGERC